MQNNWTKYQNKNNEIKSKEKGFKNKVNKEKLY